VWSFSVCLVVYFVAVWFWSAENIVTCVIGGVFCSGLVFE
jgi:hypothetical protein